MCSIFFLLEYQCLRKYSIEIIPLAGTGIENYSWNNEKFELTAKSGSTETHYRLTLPFVLFLAVSVKR